MNTQFCTQCDTGLEPNARFCSACGTAVSSQSSPQSSHDQGQGRPFRWPLLLLIIGPLLLAVVAGISIYRANSQAMVDVPDEHDASGLPFPDVPRISVAEARERFENGAAVIVDVRSVQEYIAAHIPDALSIPLNELQTRYQEIPRNAEIITYCTWPSEESSARAAAILLELGYTNVKAIRGGLGAWKEAGYPTISGS